MKLRRAILALRTLTAGGAVLLVCGCSSGTEGALSLPKLGNVASIAAPETPPTGSATELYSRVARGAMTCWFGAKGALSKDYIYHAEADAPSRGGKAEIVVHKRDPSQPNPRGAKAFRINIDPTSETEATVKTENLKMDEAVGVAMSNDVGRWSRGEQGCFGATTAVGWQESPEQAGKSPGEKVKKKPAATAQKKKPSPNPQ